MTKKGSYPKVIYVDQCSLGDQIYSVFDDADSRHDYLDALDSDRAEIAEYKFVGIRTLQRRCECTITEK